MASTKSVKKLPNGMQFVITIDSCGYELDYDIDDGGRNFKGARLRDHSTYPDPWKLVNKLLDIVHLAGRDDKVSKMFKISKEG